MCLKHPISFEHCPALNQFTYCHFFIVSSLLESRTLIFVTNPKEPKNWVFQNEHLLANILPQPC